MSSSIKRPISSQAFITMIAFVLLGIPSWLVTAQDSDPIELKLNQMLEAGDFEGSLKQANGRLSKMLVIRGRALHGLGQFEDAISAYDAALTMTPDILDIQLFRAISYGKVNRHAEAAKSYQAILDAGETSPWVAILLGNALLQSDEYEPAISAYKNAERLAESDPDAKQRAGVLTNLAMQHHELKALLQNFVAAQSPVEVLALTKVMLPDVAICQKIFKGSPHADKIAAAYAAAVESGEYAVKVPAGRTEIRMSFATSDDMNTGEGTAAEMAGGWKALRGQWESGLYVFDISFCEPGESAGMSYDGFIKVDEKWYWLPKAWRLVPKE